MRLVDAGRRRQASADAAGGQGADLLADNRPHGCLKQRPAAGCANARKCPQQGRQVRVALQVLSYRCRVGVQVEHAPHPGNHLHQHAVIAGVQFQFQGIAPRHRAHPDAGGAPRQPEIAPVAAILHGLDAGNGVTGKEIEHTFEVVGRAILQLQPNTAAVIVRAPGLAAQFSRRLPELRLYRAVEAAHAAKTRGKGNLGNRHPGFGQQFPGEEQALVQGHRLRGYAQFTFEQLAQVAFAYPQALRQARQPAAVERALMDQLQSPPHGGRRALPGRASGRGFRPAAQAGAIAVPRRLCRAVVVAHIFLRGRPRGTNRAAVDAGSAHGQEKLAVKAGVAGHSRLVTGLGVRRLDCIVGRVGVLHDFNIGGRGPPH